MKAVPGPTLCNQVKTPPKLSVAILLFTQKGTHKQEIHTDEDAVVLVARGRAGAGVILDILALEDGEVPEQQRLVRHDVERVCGKETEAHTTARQPVSI